MTGGLCPALSLHLFEPLNIILMILGLTGRIIIGERRGSPPPWGGARVPGRSP